MIMKFKNLHTQTGVFSFEDRKITFNGILDADKKLSEYLINNPNWVCFDKVDDELELLKLEAQDLEIKFHPNMGKEKLSILVEHKKAELLK